MTKRFATSSLVLTLATFTCLMGADDGCGGPPVVNNNGFDLWCGAELCYWEVESGEVKRAPTWHENDYGAEFIGPLVAISQYSPVTLFNSCFRFRAVANVEITTRVLVQVDYDDDGTYEVEQQVPTSDWARVEFELAAPRSVDGARFRLSKEGNGEAILAEMQVEKADKCSLPPLE